MRKEEKLIARKMKAQKGKNTAASNQQQDQEDIPNNKKNYKRLIV